MTVGKFSAELFDQSATAEDLAAEAAAAAAAAAATAVTRGVSRVTAYTTVSEISRPHRIDLARFSAFVLQPITIASTTSCVAVSSKSSGLPVTHLCWFPGLTIFSDVNEASWA